MQIVIDIDKKNYEFIKSVRRIMKNSDTFQRIAVDLFRATQEGTPLPEGHGDLIDRDVVYAEFDKAGLSKKEMIGKLLVFGISTVIPADKGELDNETDN